MKYMIAIDAGGTKTESVLIDQTGHIVGHDLCLGCNALDVGMEAVKCRLHSAIRRLCDQLPDGERLSAIYAGIAGSVDYYPHVLDKELTPHLPCGNVRLEGDGGNLIAGMIGHKNGCSLISGTGSTLYIRSGTKLQRYGGWGYLIDTGGSGYAIGRDAFYAAFRSFDGRGPKTVLYDLIHEQMGGAPDLNIPYIYEQGRPYIASFAHTVFAGRKMGDKESIKIFDKAVYSLAELIVLGARDLQKNFDVIIGGGIFSAFPEFGDALRLVAPPQATLIPLNVPPILGAAIEALWDVQEPETATFRSRFLQDYNQIQSKDVTLHKEEAFYA